MTKSLIAILLLLLCSCVSKGDDNPLTVPPNFAEVPDASNPEKISDEQKEENVSRLKELLLKSD